MLKDSMVIITVTTINAKHKSNPEHISDPAAGSMGHKDRKYCQEINLFHQDCAKSEQFSDFY